MPLREITLGLAERQIISELLRSGRKGNLAVARNVSALRRDLDLRGAKLAIEDLVDAIEGEYRAYVAQIADSLDTEQRRKPPETLTWDYLVYEHQDTRKSYTIEGTVLEALRDQLQDHDWCKRWGPDGRDILVTVEPEMFDAITSLSQAIGMALDPIENKRQ